MYTKLSVLANKKIIWMLLIVVYIISSPLPAMALSQEQRRIFDSNIRFFNIEETRQGSRRGCTLPGNDNQEKVWNFFIGKGYSPEQTAGIIGNMIAESGVLPMRLQGRPADEEHSSQSVEHRQSIGWGLVQWTPPGKMISPSHAEGASYETINTVEHQVDFLWKQLEGTAPSSNEKAAGDHLKQQATVADSARSFMIRYERPADQSESKVQSRITLAEDVFNRLGSLSGGSTGSGCSGTGNWTWPMDPVGTITSCFGPRQSPGGIGSTNHQGLDISTGGSGKILAADGGTVSFARSTDSGGFGIHLIIDHGNGYKTLYAHTSQLHKATGDSVTAGEHIADEGNTGSSTGAHLHFEIHKDDAKINPLDEMAIANGVNNRESCSGAANQ